jgi:integrase
VAKRLTDRTIVQVKAAESRREIPDGQCAGLYLTVHPTGAKAWALRFRSPIERDAAGQRKAKKLTLGPLANEPNDDEPQIGRPLSLTQARVLATGALEQVRRGIDPTHERRTEKAASRDEAISRSANTVDAAIIEFLTKYKGPKKRGLRDSTRNLTAYYFGLKPDAEKPGEWIKTGAGVLKRWSGRPLASITQHDVQTLVDAIADGAPVSANRTLAALKTLFKFYVKRQSLLTSPAALVDAPAAEESRDRTLSDAEVKAVWQAADAAAYPFGRLVQLLLLTGARRDELREAPWAEFDLDGDTPYWSLPGDRVKNGNEHSVPLSSWAKQILRGMPRIKGRGLLFTTTGETPYSGLSKAKRALDTASGVTGWTLHDLRRTAATGMAERCGVQPHIIEAALNHVSGESKRGVAGIYNRARYADDIRRALQAWADYVDALVNYNAANVVRIR